MVYLDVISGFLGSGKTTFANKLLSFYIRQGEKPVYIVNEYGEAGLDATIMQADGFTAVEMTNGCICCTLRGELATSMAQVMEKLKPTRIVFETSGIFVFHNFFEILDLPLLQGKCAVGNVVTVIDPLSYNSARLVYGNFIYNQIESAPTLVISKLDMADADFDYSEVVADVRNVNPTAQIIDTPQSKWTDEMMQCAFMGGILPNESIAHEMHEHEAFESISIKLECEAEDIEGFVRYIQSGELGEIVRAKGIVMQDGKAKLVNVFLSGYEIKPFPMTQTYTFTFIGRNLNKEKIMQLA